MQLEVMNIWIRATVETAIEDWMVMPIKGRIRTLLKSWM